MSKLIIVMGTAASGKTHFIEEQFGFMDYKHISIGEIQRELKTADEVDAMSFDEYFNYLAECNEKAKEYMVDALLAGENVILEHTLYKAKRRIVYTEAARKVTADPIDIYVMMPSRDRLRENLRLYPYASESSLDRVLGDMAQIEHPNPVEGFDKIYVVTDGEIQESIVSEDLVLIDRAKEELFQEKEKIEAKAKKDELIKELEYKPFWHICENCGKKKWMTAEEAYNEDWDYPPRMGVFGVLSARTCGSCGINTTVWWDLVVNKERKADEKLNISDEHKAEIINRIINEPYSLLEANDEE